jgi:hypothetical protein
MCVALLADELVLPILEQNMARVAMSDFPMPLSG